MLQGGSPAFELKKRILFICVLILQNLGKNYSGKMAAIKVYSTLNLLLHLMSRKGTSHGMQLFIIMTYLYAVLPQLVRQRQSLQPTVLIFLIKLPVISKLYQKTMTGAKMKVRFYISRKRDKDTWLSVFKPSLHEKICYRKICIFSVLQSASFCKSSQVELLCQLVGEKFLKKQLVYHQHCKLRASVILLYSSSTLEGCIFSLA